MKSILKAKDFDRAFDDGEDVVAHLDLAQAKRGGLQVQVKKIDNASGKSKPTKSLT